MTHPYAALLGRPVEPEHDERSRAFPAATAQDVHDVDWALHGPVLDQNLWTNPDGTRGVGACTGNAFAHWRNSDPNYLPGQALLVESDAVKLYSYATRIDGYRGVYPPTDTGTSFLAIAKAAVKYGYATKYTHAFGIDHALAALMLGPVMLGTVWLEGMFEPDPKTGRLDVSGKEAGGHEYLAVGYAVADDTVTIQNSWGKGWGVAGRAKMKRADLAALLRNGGDVGVPVR